MKRKTVILIGLLQALGLAFYCSLVGVLLWQGNNWFGKMNNLFGPLLFLSLFVVSALICALIALGYPFLVFWNKKKPKEALKLVAATTGWLLFLVGLFIIALAH